MSRKTVLFRVFIISISIVGMILLSGFLDFWKSKPTFKTIEKGSVYIDKIATKKVLPLGIIVRGTADDIIMQNEKIKIILASLTHKNENVPVKPGSIIDAANRSQNVDYIYQLTPIYEAKTPVDPVLTSAESVKESDDTFSVIYSGNDKNINGLTFKNTYTIKPDTNYVKITTDIENNTTGTLSLKIGDRTDFGLMPYFLPNIGMLPRVEKQDVEGDWLIATLEKFSVSLASAENAKIKLHMEGRIGSAFYKESKVEVGKTLSCSRYFVLGTENMGPITNTIYSLKNTPVGTINGKVVEKDTKAPVANAEIRIRNSDIHPHPFVRVFANEKGEFSAKVPQGKYYAIARSTSRYPIGNYVPIDVIKGMTAVKTFTVSKKTTLHYKILDEATNKTIPGKIQLQSVSPTPPVDFGPADNAKEVKNVAASPTGEGVVEIVAGKYTIVASAGTEYDINSQEVTINTEAANNVEFKLKKAFDTPGYISADLAVHTSNSYNSTISPEDRAISAAVEGVKCVVTADNNFITDLTEGIQKAGLTGKLIGIPGFKVVPDFNNPNIGDFNVFPINNKEALNKPVDVVNKNVDSPLKFIDAVKETYPGAIVQISEPITPDKGAFSLYGYKPVETKVMGTSTVPAKLPETAKGFSYDFNLFEIFEGRDTMRTRETADLFYSLLEKNPKLTAVASTDSHYTYTDEVGYPRVYVGVPTNDVSKLTQEDIIKGLKEGNVFLTNGPYVKFTVNGKTYGSMVKPNGKFVDCELEVYAAPWVNIGYIDVNKDGLFVKRFFESGKNTPLRVKEKFQLSAVRDYAANITIQGYEPYKSVVNPAGTMVSLAFTNPIIVDANGDGKYTQVKTPPPPQTPQQQQPFIPMQKMQQSPLNTPIAPRSETHYAPMVGMPQMPQKPAVVKSETSYK